MAVAKQELTDTEKQALVREVAADQYEPPMVYDVIDIQRMPREAFQAGWDAAIEHARSTKQNDTEGEDSLTVAAVLGKPTRWRDFVDSLHVERD